MRINTTREQTQPTQLIFIGPQSVSQSFRLFGCQLSNAIVCCREDSPNAPWRQSLANVQLVKEHFKERIFYRATWVKNL
jgi:hypothetical protein